ncbi:hypothetical protein O7632_27280 [Solwaraspora sp. WMMD406]|uniref:hypothetical protein n=1 Tax=Solwaraspora sp. WMMD406 TaxID=3016095 RepID=UPI002417B88F|nr:hypothetical protein [Solwaraspora sp. WMMD406]MDG4767767.1 hypothetical protein [Solwaraspora sp. WMMD406]
MMTRSELMRVRRQMHRRIQAVVAERRMAGGRPHSTEPVADATTDSEQMLVG